MKEAKTNKKKHSTEKYNNKSAVVINGPALAGEHDPDWSIIVNLGLCNRNCGINTVCLGPLDTSFPDTNSDEFDSKDKVVEDIEYDDASSDKQKVEMKISVKKLEKRKTSLTHELIKLRS